MGPAAAGTRSVMKEGGATPKWAGPRHRKQGKMAKLFFFFKKPDTKKEPDTPTLTFILFIVTQLQIKVFIREEYQSLDLNK